MASSSRPWDARLARWMIMPLAGTRITPNHVTTVRLLVGLACAASFAQGGDAWSNLGAIFLVVSNVLDHADGELARVSGQGSRFGHLYDLASDALVTVLLFVGIGFGATHGTGLLAHHGVAAGTMAGVAVVTIFAMRLRIEEILGKSGTAQPRWGGFELEDVLYLMPLVTIFGGLHDFLGLAVLVAPTFALIVAIDYVKIMRRVGHQAKKTSAFQS